MPDPLVSVLLPVWNGERYLGEAIASVLAQSYRPLEIVVVDDGSTDGSAAVARGFTSDLVELHRQANAGTAAARNAALARARGELLAHLDADDLWPGDRLARQVAALADHPEADAVSGHVEEFYSPELSVADVAHLRPPRGPLPGTVLGAMLLRREAHERLGRFDVRWRVGQDLDWYLRAVDAGFQLLMLPDLVLRRRLHTTNKGIVCREDRRQRLHILKAAIDRRRASRG